MEVIENKLAEKWKTPPPANDEGVGQDFKVFINSELKGNYGTEDEAIARLSVETSDGIINRTFLDGEIVHRSRIHTSIMCATREREEGSK